MKNLSLILISLFILATSCQKKQEKKLIGKWEIDSYTYIYEGIVHPIEDSYDYWDVEFQKDGTLIYNIEGEESRGTYTFTYDPIPGVLKTEIEVNDTLRSTQFTVVTLSEDYIEVKGNTRFADEPMEIRLFKKE